MTTKNYVLIIIFVVLAMVGSFYVGNYLASPNSQGQIISSYSDAFERAKREIPAPDLPPKPAGQTVTTITQQKVTVPTQRVINESINIGPFGAKVSIPKVITEQREIIQDTPSTKLVDASPEQIGRWNAEVKKLQDEYNATVIDRAKAIEAKNAAQRRTEFIENAKGITKDIIVPMITALTGLVGAIAALRWGKKIPSSE